MFVFPAPRPRIFHRKTGGSSPFPLENWLFWASPPSPQHFRVRNENRPFSFLQFWRIGLPAPAAASGPAPLDMDPPRAGDRPPGIGDGAVRSAGGASGALRRFKSAFRIFSELCEEKDSILTGKTRFFGSSNRIPFNQCHSSEFTRRPQLTATLLPCGFQLSGE